MKKQISRYVLVNPMSRIILVLALIALTANVQADWIPFRIVDGSIIIDVEIAGQPATAILASGSALNMIDLDFVEKYGQEFSKLRKIEADDINEKVEIWLYGGIPARLFGSELKMSNVGGYDLGKADLLLGAGFFKQSIVQIDYPQSRLQLLDKKAVDMNKHANVPMKGARGSRVPAIQVELEGNKTWLIFDTGSNSGIYVQREFTMSKGLLGAETPVEQGTIKGINQEAQTDHFLVDSVKIGPYEMENVAVDVPAEGQNSNLNPTSFESKLGTRIKKTVKTKGILGYDMLKHFVVTLDYSSLRVNLYAP